MKDAYKAERKRLEDEYRKKHNIPEGKTLNEKVINKLKREAYQYAKEVYEQNHNANSRKPVKPSDPQTEPYKNAHREEAERKLLYENDTLSARERAKLQQQLNRLGYSDEFIQRAADAIHYAQFGNSKRDKYYRPISVTVTADNKVVVTMINQVIKSKSYDMTQKIFGGLNETLFIPEGRRKDYDNTRWSDSTGGTIQTAGPNHAEARGFQEVLSHWGMDALSGSRQATTKLSCDKCKALYQEWNAYYQGRGMEMIYNITGFR